MRDLTAVAYVPDGKVTIEISFTMNGEEYSFEGDMPAFGSVRHLFPTAEADGSR